MFPISTPHSSNIKVTSCHSINFISHKKGSKSLPVSLLTNGKMSSVNSSNDSLSNNNIDFNHKIKVSELFDTFIQKIRIQSIDESLEEMVNSLLNTVNSICYSINIKKRVFKHHLGNKEYSIGKSIIAYAYRTNQLVHVPNPTTHECFDSEGDSNCCTLYIPLSNYQNEVIKVIKVHPCQGISSVQTGKYDEKKLCELLMSKFKNYSHLINLDHNNAAKKDKFRFDKVISDIQSQFEARKVDFYLYDVHDRKYRKYDHTSKIFVDINSIGFASQVIEELRPFIYADITDSESYKEGDDGPVHETVIGSLIQFESEIGAIILRGKISNSSIYTKNDANALNSYFPVLAKALGKKIKVLHVDTSVQTDEVEQKLIDVHYKECDLSNELLKVLELYETVSLTHDLKTRLSMIVEKTKTLLNVDFCGEFIDFNAHKYTKLEGIAGQSFFNTKIILLPDAKRSPYYDPYIDGHHTKNILAIPIISPTGVTIGCLEIGNNASCNDDMANTQSEDKDVFDIKTINLLKSFAVICGSMIKNSINFESSIVYYKETNHIMNSTCQKENTLEKTLNHLKYYFNGKRITLLSYNQEENKLDKIVTSGNPYENASIFARDAIDTKRTVIFNGKNIDLFTNQVDTTVDSVRSQIVIHKKLKINEIFTKFSHLEDKDLINNNNSNQKRDNIIAVPLINDHAAVIGVIELVTCAQILPDDVKLLEVAAKYLSYSVMMFKDKQYNKCITEMRAKISDEDMEKALIPIVTVLDGKTLKSLPQTCFDTMQWCGSLGYKLIFNIFSFFDLQPKFGIKSKTLFSFIESLIMSYKKVTTYNWIHAIDSFQFVFSEISSIGGSDVFTDIEILALLVASLCHHIGHKEKVINEKSEIPLTILSKTQCYTEAYFCHKAIEIISKDESNIFSELTSDDFYNIWEVIIELILSLNMRKHFHLLNESKNKLKGKTYQSMNKDEKLLTLKVILKCADFSPAARPFKIADRDRYAVPEEFFRTGKLEDVEGIVFTGKERDRCHIDHVKSINSVYEKLVLPYFEIASELFPSLISNYENVMRNYNKWCSPV